MLARFILWAILLFFIGRAIRSLMAGVVQGAYGPRDSGPSPRSGPQPQGPPAKGELMARDPVCGTYVLPSRAMSHRDKSGTHYFCSERCLDAYRQSPRSA